MSLIVPEIIIKETLEAIISFLKKDVSVINSDSYLFELFGSDEAVKLNRFNYLEQAKKIFGEKVFNRQGEPNVYLGYNMEVSAMPAIHILLPSESGKIGIGADEGYMEAKFTEGNKKWAPTYTMMSNANYQLIITSDNSSEVVLIYHTIRACLLGLYDQLEFRGLRIPQIGGADLNIQSDLVPPNIFHRSLMLSFEYEINCSAIAKHDVVKRIVTEQLLVGGN